MKASTPASFILMLFGATGDLALRKLFPALFRYCRDSGFSAQTRILGVSRTPMALAEFHALIEKNLRQHLENEWEDDTWQELLPHLDYLSTSDDEGVGQHNQGQGTRGLAAYGKQHPTSASLPGVIYLSTPSSAYGSICDQLAQAGMINDHTRLVLEKPIGHDLASAMDLNKVLSRHFSESQIYRIDHYLGKETVQNLFVLRFANPLFESLWNHHYVDHIQITIAESIGVEGRIDFYDETGALRDMLQNHLLQMLCIVAMEPPSIIEPDQVRDEKLKVLKSLRPLNEQSIVEQVVRGQYANGVIDGRTLCGYNQENGAQQEGSANPEGEANRDSSTETFVALKLNIDNLRWAGVPFYLRTGKRMPRRTCQIVVQFKPIAHSIFNRTSTHLNNNRLVITLQPDESIKLRLCGKRPGRGMDVRSIDLDLSAPDRKANGKADAYQRLLADVVHGDPTLFVRQDEMEAAWAWVDPIISSWRDNSSQPDPYNAGTWGPASSTLLLARDGNVWHEGAV